MVQDGRSPQTGDRQSIWSVPGHLWRWYVVIFVIQYFVFLGLTIWDEVANRCGDGAVRVILNVQTGMTGNILNIAASTYVILEGFMLAQWLRERDQQKREKADDKMKEMGRLEERQVWQAWYERMQTARQEGRPFDEPPPITSQDKNGK